MAGRSDTDGPPVELNPCPICLGPVTDAAYLDECFHKYCYGCILHWMKVVACKCSEKSAAFKCPLCKMDNFSIIHGSDGVYFDRHYFGQDPVSRSFFTKAHKYRLQCYYCEAGTVTEKFNVPRYWKLRKYRQSSCWLPEWMRREIQALTQEEDVEVIVQHVLGVIDSFRRNEQRYSGATPDENREIFRNAVFEAVEPFLTGRSSRFIDELELFLASELKIDAYDKVYIRQHGWRIPDICDEDEEPLQETPAVPYLFLFDEVPDTTD